MKSIRKLAAYSIMSLTAMLAFFASLIVLPYYLLQHIAFFLRMGLFGLTDGKFGYAELHKMFPIDGVHTAVHKQRQYMECHATIFWVLHDNKHALANHLIFRYGSKAFCSIFLPIYTTSKIRFATLILLAPIIATASAFITTIISATISAEQTFRNVGTSCTADDFAGNSVQDLFLGTSVHPECEDDVQDIELQLLPADQDNQLLEENEADPEVANLETRTNTLLFAPPKNSPSIHNLDKAATETPEEKIPSLDLNSSQDSISSLLSSSPYLGHT